LPNAGDIIGAGAFVGIDYVALLALAAGLVEVRFPLR
jgi:hypothetical protein